MYELNEIDGMVEGIFMVMEEHGSNARMGIG